MATVQERRPETASADEFGTLTIHDMLERGDYVTRHKYTVGQQEEIADIIREAMRAGARAARPGWELALEVERTDDDGDAA